MRGFYQFRWIALAICALAISVTGFGADHLRAPEGARTPLDEYVAQPDPHYAWEIVTTFEGDNFTSYTIDLTSQAWQPPEKVDPTIWKHWLTVVVPKEVKSDKALLLIGGGSNKSDAPKAASAVVRQAALSSGAVCAELGQIPNQPTVFESDGRKRSEDAIIAYGWAKFMRSGDPLWLLRLPMTKAAVRAMDTIQDMCAKLEPRPVPINGFVVVGGSKRGWTTWTTAAVDNRVVACMPAVIDLLNMVPSFIHHYQAYGNWAPAVFDYVKEGVMGWMNSPEMDALCRIVEPYSYRDRLTMPKYIVNAAGDQFFLNDSWKFYLHDLQGPTWIRYCPNSGHGLENAKPYEAATAFLRFIAENKPVPTYQWTFEDANTVRVTADTKPLAVKLWQATNPERRDFKVDTFGRNWTSTDLQPEPDGSWRARVEPPEKGWTAFLVELTFPGPGEETFVVTTPTQVVPDTLPNDPPKPGDWSEGFLHKKPSGN
ncbi:MAG: PhoPQ-activated pathogenicity-related family protein [Candidatus Hydrogenedentes bacterium]|nr:PhoPQ-activated pathogenicity-related family protein [Candidatus Hydrogenedentota bacterium]